MAAMETKDSIQPTNYFLPPETCLSITSIQTNGSNYAQRAQAVEVFLLGRKKFDYIISEPPKSTTLNMLIGEPKMHKLEVACGIAWSLRSVVVWFSYQWLNLFSNKPRNFTLVLTDL